AVRWSVTVARLGLSRLAAAAYRGPPPASGVGSTRPVSGCDGIVAAGPSPGEGNLPGPPPASGVGWTRSVAGPCCAAATLIAAELARAAIANIPMTGLRMGGLLL